MERIIKKIGLIIIGLIAAVCFFITGCSEALIDSIQDDVENPGNQSEINIKQDTENIPSGGDYPFGNIVVDSPAEKTFNIENQGQANLELTATPPVAIINQQGTAFSISLQPESSVNPNKDVSFKILFDPQSTGLKEAVITIPNNDSDENPYIINLTGLGIQPGDIAIPNGGEAYKPGDTCSITWGVFDCGNVKIELYKNGIFDSTIIASTPDDGSFDWTISGGQAEGADYKVKITAVDVEDLFDESNANFSIGTITVTTPNGGQVFNQGENYDITWTSVIGGIVNIELYKGGSFYSTVASSTLNNGGPFSWPIPSVEGNDFKIRISSTANTSIYDESDAVFVIGTITVDSPNGGEALKPGNNHDITWTSVIGGNVKIELYKGGSFHTEIISSTANNGGPYSWTVPSENSSDFKMRITSTVNTGINDMSNANFGIGTITIDSPDGAEIYEAGTQCSISWTSLVGGNVKIELYKGGSFHSEIASSTLNDGSYAWDIPSDSNTIAGNNFKIKITSTGGSAVTDESNSNFIIRLLLDLGYASTGNGYDISMALDDNDNKPIVAYTDPGNGNKVHVLKWSSGTTWTDLGYPSSGSGYFSSLIYHYWDWILVVFQDYADTDHRAHVMKWVSGTTWESRGFGSLGEAYDISIAQTGDARFVVSSQEYDDANRRAHVMKWSVGTTWSDLGYPSTGRAEHTIIGASSNWYSVLFHDYTVSTRLHVKRWNGSDWTDLGYPGTGSSWYYDMVGHSDGYPIVVFSDGDNGNKAHVKKWNGSSWVDYGYASPGDAYNNISMAIGSDNKPVVLFTDKTNGNKAHIMKWVSGTTWQDWGFVSSGWTNYNGIEIDTSDNFPVIVYQDQANGNKVHILKRYYY